jgi:hypothetical protein
MKSRFIFSALCLSLFAITPAKSYDTLEADFAACQGNGPREQIVAACTRLIDNAQTENELVGYFYGLRASNNDDKAQNCHDANKVLELTQNPDLVNAANELVRINC